MARPDVGITCQYGAESTPGTGVTAGKKFSSTQINFDAVWVETFYRAYGGIFPTTGVRQRQWAEGAAQGIVSYNEYHIFLASMFGHGTVTTASGASTWPISPTLGGSDTRKTLTYQCGDSAAAREVNYAQHVGLDVTVGENEITFNSPFLARAVDNTATLDTLSSTIPEQPVSVSDVDWYLDTTWGGIGTTKVDDALSGSFSIPPLVVPKVVQNTTYTSFRELVAQSVEDARVMFVTEYNSQARAFYDAFNVDVKPTRYLQLKFTGDIITGAVAYLIKHNFVVKPEKPVERRAPSGAVYGYEFPFRIVSDGTRAMDFTIINTQPTL